MKDIFREFKIYRHLCNLTAMSGYMFLIFILLGYSIIIKNNFNLISIGVIGFLIFYFSTILGKSIYLIDNF